MLNRFEQNLDVDVEEILVNFSGLKKLKAKIDLQNSA
jgi:hypothetical protein